MNVSESSTIHYRPMLATDIGQVPTQCQGNTEALAMRIITLGAGAILAFDGEQHVAQLQFRRYDRALRSPDGLWDPLYWGDFGAHSPELPQETLAIFCYHVGQLEDSDARDARYQGRGIGLAMLDFFIGWATAAKFKAIIAKFTPATRAVMSFMGGQPEAAYHERGFVTHASWVDQQLLEVIRDKKLLGKNAIVDRNATVGCCVKQLQS